MTQSFLDMAAKINAMKLMVISKWYSFTIYTDFFIPYIKTMFYFSHWTQNTSKA